MPSDARLAALETVAEAAREIQRHADDCDWPLGENLPPEHRHVLPCKCGLLELLDALDALEARDGE